MTTLAQFAHCVSLFSTLKTMCFNLAGSVKKMDGLLPKGGVVANIYIGSNGLPVEQSDDGAFYVTQEKTDTSQKFEEIVNGPTEES